MALLVDRSPELETLILQPSRHARGQLTAEFAQSLSGLKKLTKLVIKWDHNSAGDCLSFFEKLGESCNQLQHLELGKLPFKQQQLLSLVLGEIRISLLPERFKVKISKEDGNIHRVQFAYACVTPICNSLTHLEYNNELGSAKPWHRWPVFLLRHFPQLQVWKSNEWCTVISNVLVLYKEALDCTDPVKVSLMEWEDEEESISLEWTYNSPPCK